MSVPDPCRGSPPAARHALGHPVAGLAVLWLVGPVGGLAAQSAFDHSAHIGATLPPGASIERLSVEDLQTLAQDLLDEGQLFLDLYEMHLSVGLEYSLLRDTIAAENGGRVPEAAHFVGRHLIETGQPDEARPFLERSSRSTAVAAGVRDESRAWLEALDGVGQRWQRQVLEWREGREPTAPACPSAAPRSCQLLGALLDGDAGRIVAERAVLIADTSADYRHAASFDGREVEIGMYDPLDLYLLAAADFRLTATALNALPGYESVRAYALLRSHRISEARAVAGTGGDEMAALVRAELSFQAGRAQAARAEWASLTRDEEYFALLAMDSRSLVDPAFVRADVFQPDSALFRRGAYADQLQQASLIRALMRTGAYEEATAASDASYRLSWLSDLNVVMPSTLVLRAHAIYRSGRQRYKEARELTWAVRDDVAGARPVAVMLQAVTTLLGPGDVRIGGMF